MPASGGTPLARLHDTATQLGIIVVDAVDDDGPLLDDDTAAFIACGVCIALNPGLDDGLRADVLAMALALTYALSPATADHGGDITAASGFVLISRTRETGPVSALGLLATVIAHEHGHDSASAAFEYTWADFELAQHAAKHRDMFCLTGVALSRRRPGAPPERPVQETIRSPAFTPLRRPASALSAAFAAGPAGNGKLIGELG
jgi:hypothetical protein